jgi:hypothetical protein
MEIQFIKHANTRMHWMTKCDGPFKKKLRKMNALTKYGKTNALNNKQWHEERVANGFEKGDFKMIFSFIKVYIYNFFILFIT